jgi:FkbM family methyltransferase
MYYHDVGQSRRMERFYAQLLGPGDLAFDIGAHVGSRTLAWIRMGARVVAVEPLPSAMRMMRVLYGRHPRVTLVQAAAGDRAMCLPLMVCKREPTVSTLSPEWANRMVRERDAFRGVKWATSSVVKVTTLDDLIGRYGLPAFCKIDVEGYDLKVLRGLSRPLAALSFEYVPPALDLALACVERVRSLGEYEFNWSSGESMAMHWGEWVDPDTLANYLRDCPAQSSPGDVYARNRLAEAATRRCR